MLGASSAANSDAHSKNTMAGSVPNAFAPLVHRDRGRHANGLTVNTDIMNNIAPRRTASRLPQFVISKDRATPATVPMIGPFFYDYTVFAGDENFTVTEPNDIKFLEYFYARCIADDEATSAQQLKRGPGLISRIFRWMAQPI